MVRAAARPLYQHDLYQQICRLVGLCDNYVIAMLDLKIVVLLLFVLRIISCHLNFISLSMRFALGTSYIPAFEVGLDRYSRQYPALFANYTYTRIYIREAGVGSCAAGGRQNVIDQLIELYSSGVLQRPNTIIIAPIPCLVPTAPIADFGRELDLLVLDCAPADAALANRQRFPTVVSFSYADVTAYGAAMVALMRRFAWKNVALISDVGANAQFRDSGKVAQICGGVLSELSKVLTEVNFLLVKTEDKPNSWTTALKQAQLYSRVFIVCTYPRSLRALLMAAVELDMARGEYVFFSFFNMRMPHESLMIWEKGDEQDEIIRPMVPNVFVISSPSVDWGKISNLTKKIVARRKVWITRPPEEHALLEDPDFEFNEIAITCSEMTEMMSKVFHAALNKSDGRGSRLFDSATRTSGRRLAELFYQQTIFGEDVGKEISISASGMRRFKVEIQQYNFSAKRFEQVLVYDTDTKQIQPVPGIDVAWKSGHVPVDRPRCLFEEDCVLEHNIRSQNKIIWGLSATVTATVTVLAVAGLVVVIRRNRVLHQHEWMLDAELLIFKVPSEQRQGSGMSRTELSRLTLND